REWGKFFLRVIDLPTGKERRIPLEKQPWEPIRLSPEGRFVSASLEGSEFVTWDTRTGEIVHRQPRAAAQVLLGADAATDGKGLARSVQGVWADRGREDLFAPAYGAVVVTDHLAGREWKMNPLPWSVYSGGGRFSPDGSKLILQGNFDGNFKGDSVSVWDV